MGSFGEGVYKIGMTRRLEPMDRVKELGDASVPFGFDVHAMIYSEDAPNSKATTNTSCSIASTRSTIARSSSARRSQRSARKSMFNIETHWTMVSEAAEYRESKAIEAAISENPEAPGVASRQYSLEDLEAMNPDPSDDGQEIEEEAVGA